MISLLIASVLVGCKTGQNEYGHTPTAAVVAPAPGVPAPAVTVPVRPSVIRIKAGVSASCTDSSGNTWLADQGFKGGDVVGRPDLEIANTKDPILYRAEHTDTLLDKDARFVTIKVLAAMYPSDRDLLEFRHQYAIAKNLYLPGIVRHHSLETYERGYALVLEDFGGISLASQILGLAVADVLAIGIQLADTLHGLGQQKIVHKDMKAFF